MKLNELTANTLEKHRVITYNVDHTKAVYHQIHMRHMAENIYVGDTEYNAYGSNTCMVYVLFPEYSIGIAVRSYDDDTEDSVVLADIDAECLDSAENFIYNIHEKISHQDWITLPEMELVRVLKPEIVPDVEKSRMAYKEHLEARRRGKEQKRRDEEMAYARQRNEEAKETMQNAINVIRNGGTIKNSEVEIFNDMGGSKSFCVIGRLMDAYSIKIPIRTRGWINNNLKEIVITKDGHCTNCRYWASGKSKGSQVVFDYIEKLISAVRSGDAEIMAG